MMRTHLAVLFAGMALAATAQPAIGGSIPFFDDFEDGGHEDGNPVLWHQARDRFSNGGRREVVDGSLIMSGDDYSSIWVDDTADTTDVSLRASIRFLDPGGTWLFAARSTETADRFYWGGITSDGLIWIGDWATESGIVERNRMSTLFDPTTEDVTLQMDVFDVQDGVEVSLFAWGQGQRIPDGPQLRFTDRDGDVFSEGMIGMFTQFGTPTTVAVRYFEASPEPIEDTMAVLQPGDADQDNDFDQADLVQVAQSGKYLTGQVATWGEGDWDGAPGGQPGTPPAGDGLFDELDIISALAAGSYLTGPYAAASPDGIALDARTALGFDASTEEMLVDAPEPSTMALIVLGACLSLISGRCFRL